MPDQKKTKKEYSEEASGAMVALFSITVIFLAVFACVLVTVLTVKPVSSGGQHGTVPSTDSEPPVDPTFNTTPVFAPSSASVRPFSTDQTQPAATESLYSILVDATDGRILAGKNYSERFHPASMTKVMTLVVACERLREGDLDNNLTFTTEINSYVRPNSGGYRGASCHWADVGDGATLRDQLYGIAVESAADCSVMVACYIVGKSPAESEAQFVAWMNEKATQLGLENTHFDNIIGYESENNYTTASDMAAIMVYALKCPLIAEMLSTPTRIVNAYGYNSGGDFVYYNSYLYSTLFNANADRSSRMRSYREKYGTDFALSKLTFMGGKTGTLGASPNWIYSLVSYAVDANGNIYVAVTSNTGESALVMKDAKALYDTYTP